MPQSPAAIYEQHQGQQQLQQQHHQHQRSPRSTASLNSRGRNRPTSLLQAVETGIDPFASRSSSLTSTASSRDSSVNSFPSSFSNTSRSLAAKIYKPTPFTLSIYSHRHNTHMTLTGPFPPKSQLQGPFDKRKAISVSCGNIGFRKAARGTFDAGFQLAAFVMGAVAERNILPLIERDGLEIKFRGFGQGRDAVEKALLGTEGRHLRRHVVRVSDTTRLKFGGTRSPNPRRLG